jgi:hypothetical protein
MAESLDIGDLPIVPGSMRATHLFRSMRSALSTIRLKRLIFWDIHPGSGWELAYRLAYVNRAGFMAQMALASVGAVLYYAPPFFLQKLVKYLETDPERHDRSWGWFYSFGIFATTASLYISGTYTLFPRTLGLIITCISHWSDVVSFNNDAAGQHTRATELNSVCQDTRPKRCRLIL